MIMADNDNHDCYGYFRDQSGVSYTTPDNKPPTAYTPIKISENGQTYDGTWVGGYAQKNNQ